ncbi:carboxypeptidase [Bacteroidia bacterium]|nr:carboxypeptidase [Bacteroidia bacterium]
MKRIIKVLCLCALVAGSLSAQVSVNPDTLVVTKHQTTIKGQAISYTATTGNQPVWDDNRKAIAAVNYTYYERDGIKDRSARPLVVSFNGGPGTSSLWMQLGFTGPALLKIDSEGYPVMPYGTENNPYSILDVADIVYINPVNTGYSRILDKDTDRKIFFGVNEDIKYLASWITTFITRQNRWESPKYLIGESYGTTRASGLAQALQSTHWVFLNGVILVSATDLGLQRGGPAREALTLPYMAATAWYHKALASDLQQKDLLDILPEVEKFTVDEYLPALAWGGALPADKRKEIAKKAARYSGLSEKAVLDHNLTIPTRFFWKELLRDKGFTVGRLDSRYKGIDNQDGGEVPDYNAEMVSWEHSFTPAINHYLRNELNYKTDLEYYVFGPVRPWNNENNHTGEDLMKAVAQNPYLKVLLLSGYYDGACDYFNGKYNFWQMDKGGKFQDRFLFKGYRSGHMMYIRNEDLKQANDDLRDFIKSAIPATGVPAKY